MSTTQTETSTSLSPLFICAAQHLRQRRIQHEMDPQMSWHSHHAQLHDHYDQPEQPLSTRLPVTHLSIEQLQAIVHAQKKFGTHSSVIRALLV